MQTVSDNSAWSTGGTRYNLYAIYWWFSWHGLYR